jgi:uncharacterized membrane protein
MFKLAQFFDKYHKFMLNVILILQISTYSTSAIVITFSLLYALYIGFTEYQRPTVAFYDVRTILGEAVALSLSIILCVEILKLFTVREYKQLIIVTTLVLLKLLVTYSVSTEISSASADTINRVLGQQKVNKLLNKMYPIKNQKNNASYF